jgi:hypothetical protein
MSTSKKSNIVDVTAEIRTGCLPNTSVNQLACEHSLNSRTAEGQNPTTAATLFSCTHRQGDLAARR